jgi:hypothetical protein
MTVNEAAKEFRALIKAPLWALSVAAVRENGDDLLVIRVDPNYRDAPRYPETFRGFKVRMEWRSPVRAHSQN